MLDWALLLQLFMTGVLMARKGLAKPVGSMTQYDKMRVGRGENKKVFALW